MKITTITGNLLTLFTEGEIDAIAHCCNCKGVMGAGIALQIKKQFPKAYAAYKNIESEHGLKLGWYSVAGIDRETQDITGLIFNLHGQKEYGGGNKRHLDYGEICRSLERVRDHHLLPDNYTTFGVPYKMGCERAGGDWDVVLAILKSVFKDTSIEVIVVSLPEKNTDDDSAKEPTTELVSD